MFIADHTVTMVTYCVTKMITTCSPMVGQCFDSMIVGFNDPYQNLSAGNCFEPSVFDACVCLVIDHEFCHDIVKVAMDPRGDKGLFPGK